MEIQRALGFSPSIRSIREILSKERFWFSEPEFKSRSWTGSRGSRGLGIKGEDFEVHILSIPLILSKNRPSLSILLFA